MPRIQWNEPHNDEGDRYGDTHIAGAVFWEIGANHDGTWNALLIRPDNEGYADIARGCATEREAMDAAEAREQTHAATALTER